MLAVTLAFVRACGGDEDLWEERWRALGEPAGTDNADQDAPTSASARSPNRTPSGSSVANALLVKLRDKPDQHRVVLVTGASGSGKSSLLRAGLLAAFNGSTQLITPGQRLDFDDVDLLVVDQVEELFTLHPDPAERTAFIQRLLDAAGKVVPSAPTSTATAPSTPSSSTPSRTPRSSPPR